MSPERPLKLWIDPDGAVWIEDPDGRALPLAGALAAAALPAPPQDAPPPRPRFHALRAAGAPAPWPLEPAGRWALHDALLAAPEGAAAPSLLDLKRALARETASACALCAHACGVDRLAGERGRCRVGATSYVGAASLHLGEETPISPSFGLALTGCSWHCAYCHVPELINRVDAGRPLGPEHRELALAAAGARSLSFVGGNPDQHLVAILDWIAELPADWALPLVWNANLYGSPALYRLLEGVVDWHVADWRYGSDACGARLSGVPDAATIAARNLALLATGRADLIVRVLVLPGHLACCALPAIAAIARLAPAARVNVMGQYHPAYAVGRLAPELDRVTPAAEVEAARAAARAAGLALVSGAALHEL